MSTVHLPVFPDRGMPRADKSGIFCIIYCRFIKLLRTTIARLSGACDACFVTSFETNNDVELQGFYASELDLVERV